MQQDDFRRLLAAPRPATTGQSTTPAAAVNKPKPRPFQQPKQFQPKQKDGGTNKPQDSSTSDDQGAKGNFRDRAYERRTGKLAQTEEERLLAEIDYERSKMLGGDLAHTHLVKGLDFALLARLREEEARKKKQQEEEEERKKQPEQQQQKPASSPGPSPVAVPSKGLAASSPVAPNASLAATQEDKDDLASLVAREAKTASGKAIGLAALRFSAMLHLSGSTDIGFEEEDITSSKQPLGLLPMSSLVPALIATLPPADDRFSAGRVAFEFPLPRSRQMTSNSADDELILIDEVEEEGGYDVYHQQPFTTIMRSRADASILKAAWSLSGGNEDPSGESLVPRLDGKLRNALAAALAPKQTLQKGKEKAKAAATAPAAPAAGAAPSAAPAKPAAAQPVAAPNPRLACGGADDDDDDDGDIFGGAGIYVKPKTAEELAAEAAAAAAALGLDPEAIVRAGLETHSAAKASSGSAAGSSQENVKRRIAALMDEDGDEGAAASDSKAKAKAKIASSAAADDDYEPPTLAGGKRPLYSDVVIDANEDDEEANDASMLASYRGSTGILQQQQQQKVGPSAAKSSPADPQAGAKAAGDGRAQYFAGVDTGKASASAGGAVAGVKRPRPQDFSSAPAASSSSSSSTLHNYDVLGGDVAPAAGASGGRGGSYGGSKQGLLAAYDRYDRAGGEGAGGGGGGRRWFDDADEKEDHRERQKKRNKANADFQRVQQIMKEKWGKDEDGGGDDGGGKD